MRLVVRAAEVLRAPRLIDVTAAHIDSCLYHGEASLHFVDRLLNGGAKARVPTTLNVGALDLLHPELWRGDRRTAQRGRLLMDRYWRLGCRPTFTCAPYQLPDARPGLGQHVAWAESNAIVFANSVLGARTNRYGDFIDVAAAITGRVPYAGLHRTDARRATVVLRLSPKVPSVLLDADELYPVLGILLGRVAGSRVAVLEGLRRRLSEDRLKQIGAAAASSGGVAMFHVVGSTPEAPTLDATFVGRPPDEVHLVTLDELRAVRDSMSGGDASGARLRAVALGTPHASLDELERIATLIGSARVARGVECIVSTGREVLAAAEELGIVERLRAAGVGLLVDTCSYVAPVLRSGDGPVMTDSGKWAYYAPATIGASVILGSTQDCVRSAVAGRVVRDGAVWESPS